MLNEMILQGRLTAAPELKSTQSGVFWCDFTVAWNRKYKESEDVCFLTCRAWRERAEFVTKYFKKGDPIAVVGIHEIASLACRALALLTGDVMLARVAEKLDNVTERTTKGE